MTRLGLFVVALTAALVIAEGLLRLATPASWLQRPNPVTPWTADDPIYGWKNRANFSYATFQTDADGFRRIAANAPSDRRETVIACLGDSSTFGLWTERDASGTGEPIAHWDSYPAELARILGDRAPVRVINAGVVGYTSSHALRQLVLAVLPQAPDIITVRVGLNDQKLARFPRHRVSEPPSALGRALFYGSANLRLARLAMEASRSAAVLLHDGNRLVLVSPDRFAADLRRMAALSRDEGFELLLLDYPLRPRHLGEHERHRQVVAEYGRSSVAEFYAVHEQYQSIVARVSREESIPLLLSAKVFDERGGEYFGETDFVHPNAAGSAELGRRIADEIERLGWIDGATPADSP
jgi:lysophospholipase L1-like esterase